MTDFRLNCPLVLIRKTYRELLSAVGIAAFHEVPVHSESVVISTTHSWHAKADMAGTGGFCLSFVS